MKSKEEIIRSFENKILAKACFKNNLHYTVNDLANQDDLIHILYDILSHDWYLTTDGFKFIKEYYGFKKIIKLIRGHGGELAQQNDDDIIKWLNANNGIPKIADTIDLSYMFRKK